MRAIAVQLWDYYKWVDKSNLLIATVCTALAVFCNYYYGLHNYFTKSIYLLEYLSWFVLFLVVFGIGYLLVWTRQKTFTKSSTFWFLFIIAPAIFAWKMSYDPQFDFTADKDLNSYWNQVVYWPFKLLVISCLLYSVARVTKEKQKLYGVNRNGHDLKPYMLMLFIMVPLIAAASTQADFLEMYPKLKNIAFLSNEENNGWYKLLYELSYGSDFFGIELFFRGFLVLGFMKWVGKDAILPMAMFYCTIHFGKPLAECISSFFGGIILGVVVYHSRTIIGGFLVHVGIAWLMELGGYIGNLE